MCRQRNTRLALNFYSHLAEEEGEQVSPLPEIADTVVVTLHPHFPYHSIIQKLRTAECVLILVFGLSCVLSSNVLVIPTYKLLSQKPLDGYQRFYLDSVTVVGSFLWLITFSAFHLPHYNTERYKDLTEIFQAFSDTLYISLGLNGVLLLWGSVRAAGLNWNNVTGLDFLVVQVFVVFLVLEFLFAVCPPFYRRWKKPRGSDATIFYFSVFAIQATQVSCLLP